jgi:integrase
MPRKRRGRGEGGLFQRSDGYWVGSVSGIDGNGKRRRLTVYGKTKQIALAKLKDVRPIDGGYLGDAKTTTIAGWLDRWCESAKLAPTTRKRYAEIIRVHLKPLIGSVRLAKLAKVHVGRLLDDLEQRGVKARVRQMCFRVLHTALNVAVADDLLVANPAARIKQPRVPAYEMKTYSPEETARLLAAAQGHRLYALLVVALDAGARQGEIFGLRWPGIDFATGVMSVTHSLEEIRGVRRLKEPKNGKVRRVLLTPFAVEALADHRKLMLAEGHYQATGPVFPSNTGDWLRKSNFRRQVFHIWQQKAGIPRLRFHDLRHTAATNLLQASIPLTTVAERLGHAKPSFTLNTYCHALETTQKVAAEKLDQLFRKSTGS